MMAHDVWLKLRNTYEGSSEIKSSHRDTYNRQYQTFSQKPGESLDDCFAHFESIVSSLRSCGPLAYSDNERAKQLLYAPDDSVWGMRITALEEFADFATLDTENYLAKRRRSFKRWCPERVPPSATSTSPAMTPPASRRMRGPSARQVTSPAFASWASRRGTSPTLTLM
jgi:hypothetical protein